MLKRLSAELIRCRRRVLLGAGLVTLAAAVIAAPAMDKLSNGGFTDPKTPSARAGVLLDRHFGGVGDYNYILLASAAGSVDAAATAAEGRDISRTLAAQPGVTTVASYWQTLIPSLRSRAGNQALILAHLAGDEDQAMRTAKRITPLLTGRHGPLRVKAGGGSVVNYEASAQIKKDLAKAESIAVPVTLVILVLVFGGLTAAVLPLAIAAFSITGGIALLRLLALVTSVSVFAVNLTTALGLGLAIDYSLFIVSRFREELRAGREVPEALTATVATAGRTVLFSAVTVLISLSALLVFPLYFLRSFAYAGITAVALAAVGAVVILPAVLATLGRRVETVKMRRLPSFLRLDRGPRGGDAGFWHRLAGMVMRRPAVIGLGAVALILVLAAPALRLSFSLPDDRVLPSNLSAAQVGQAVRSDFAASLSEAVDVVLPAREVTAAATQAYAQRLSRLPGITRVDTYTGSYAGGGKVAGPGPFQAQFVNASNIRLSLATDVAPFSARGRRLVGDVRSQPAPYGTALVTGGAAVFSDTLHSLYSALPWALLIVALATAILLFLFVGSVLVPIQAIILNCLTLAATFGVLVYVFQQGHLQWLTGHFTQTGQVDVATPILMACILFGVSMDYEVFLLSRIKEEYDRTGDSRQAVALGLERAGRIVTAAAFLLAIVFAALMTSGFTHIKTLGLGAALAVLLDAVVVRALLAPATMRLAGRFNWWAPTPLRRLHHRLGLKHAVPEPAWQPGAARPAPVGAGLLLATASQPEQRETPGRR